MFSQKMVVQQVEATSKAFAAILESGNVVTWGDPTAGGHRKENRWTYADLERMYIIYIYILYIYLHIYI